MVRKENLLAILEITKELKILYVEDDEVSRNQALKLLENYFEHIDTAVNGTQGLETYINYKLETNSYYDLVITDIMMPIMDGIEMTKAIYCINKEQKIIVVSAFNDKKYLIELINIGVEGFMQKPLALKQITDALSELCKNTKENYVVSISNDYTYNSDIKNLFFKDKLIKTTINENKFIEFLIQNKNNPSAPEDIFNYINYDEPSREFSSNSIKGLVKRLRKKLPIELILYNRTTGYKLQN